MCDWSKVGDSETSTDLPSCVEGTCSGHTPSDVLPFSFRLHLGGDKESTIQFTNQELYDFIHPYRDELPYMYDHYDWKHCTESGAYLPDVMPYFGRAS